MINGNFYRDMIISAANAIEKEKEKINALNIFPVPDGDTGTNMSLTMQAGKREIENFSGSLSDCSGKIASALLRGGRGNSGVILSLFFRGVSKELNEKEQADAVVFAKAFRSGVESAYKAVRHPTEGTILTVMRFMADRANEIAEQYLESDNLEEFFNEIILTANQTLDATPDMLPVLKQANVVDAGGKGFVTIMNGMLSVVSGKGIVEPGVPESSEKTNVAADFAIFDNKDIKFGYCTECIISKAPSCTQSGVNAFSSFINGIGDSVVFIDDEEIIKFHVHTNDPGRVLSECLKYGSLATVKIENMRNQHSEISIKSNEGTLIKPSEKKYGFVSIAAGDGFYNVFKDLGVDNIVNGGQTMNPSTEDIVSAINITPSEVVFVFPNNKNIYMAAKQAEELVTDKRVIVLKTVSVPQGISALLAFNPDAEVEENLEAMKEAIKQIKTAKMTFAARDSVFNDTQIKEGQILGLLENDIKVVSDTKENCLKELSPELQDASYITIFYGEESSEDDANKMADILKESLGSDKEIMVVNGGQPVYYYIISAE